MSLFLAIAVLAAGCQKAPAARTITVATTTSVGNSGLLDVLVRAYRDQAGVEIRTQLVGSGIALRMLGNRDVDVVISHAPSAEQEALREHATWVYRKLMFNDFVVVGPPDDPARVNNANNVAAAMRRIAESNATFLSRGDRSGTHEREIRLWDVAGMRPPAARLIVAGSGMGSTLRAASEAGAYTLTDRATYSQLAGRLRLTIWFQGGAELMNTYAVIVDPAGAHAADAQALATWLTEANGRDVIASFRIGGQPAFTPWPTGRPRNNPSDLPN